MDLFSNLPDASTNFESKGVFEFRRLNKNKLTHRFDIYATFIRAIRARDKEVISFLLAAKHPCGYWKANAEFVDDYILNCEEFEKKQPVAVDIYEGLCMEKGEYWLWDAVLVKVIGQEDKQILWKFALAYQLGNKNKILLHRTKYFCQ